MSSHLQFLVEDLGMYWCHESKGTFNQNCSNHFRKVSLTSQLGMSELLDGKQHDLVTTKTTDY